MVEAAKAFMAVLSGRSSAPTALSPIAVMMSPRESDGQHSVFRSARAEFSTCGEKVLRPPAARNNSHLALKLLQRRLDEMVVVGVLDLDVGGLHLGQECGEHVEHDLRAFLGDLPVRRVRLAHLLV